MQAFRAGVHGTVYVVSVCESLHPVSMHILVFQHVFRPQSLGLFRHRHLRAKVYTCLGYMDGAMHVYFVAWVPRGPRHLERAPGALPRILNPEPELGSANFLSRLTSQLEGLANIEDANSG